MYVKKPFALVDFVKCIFFSLHGDTGDDLKQLALRKPRQSEWRQRLGWAFLPSTSGGGVDGMRRRARWVEWFGDAGTETID